MNEDNFFGNKEVMLLLWRLGRRY